MSNTLLEEVARLLRVLLEESDRIARLDVGREHEHCDVGELGADALRGDDSLVRVRRRHLDVDDHRIRLRDCDLAYEPPRILGLADDLDPGLVEQTGDAFAGEHRVVRDHDAHGITALIVVPPAELWTEMVPSIAPTRSTAAPRDRPHSSRLRRRGRRHGRRRGPNRRRR